MSLGGDKSVRSILLAFVVFFGLIFSFGFGSALTDCSIDPTGTYCGECVQWGCYLEEGVGIDFLYETLDYYIGGTKTCQGGVCSSSTCQYATTCADTSVRDNWPLVSGIGFAVGCEASCDQDSDCPQSYFSEGVCSYDGFCDQSISCNCNYRQTQQCLPDEWYDTTNTQWISDGECTEKEQREQEDRNYICTANGCDYQINDYRWVDTGATRNKQDGTLCGESSQGSCDGQDTCLAGVCEENIFQNNIECRPAISGGCDIPEYCDGENYDCSEDIVVEKGTLCEDGLFCTVEECDGAGECVFSKDYDCSEYDKKPFSMCEFNPDDKPFTLDVFLGFNSVCNEAGDSCTRYNQWDDLTHTCSQGCGAQCDEDSDCQSYCGDGITLYDAGKCALSSTCDCSYTQTDCLDLSCKSGLYCVIEPGISDGDMWLYVRGDEFGCVSNGDSHCGKIGTIPCTPMPEIPVCNQQNKCATSQCLGTDYICSGVTWVNPESLTEICNDGIDNNCNGLIDCADSRLYRFYYLLKQYKGYGNPFIR